MDGRSDSGGARKRASTSVTEGSENKIFKGSLDHDIQQVIEILGLENNDENVRSVTTRLINHEGNENRVEIVIEDLLYNPIDDGNKTNNGQQEDGTDDQFFIDVCNLMSILKTANPNEQADENLIYETLLKYSDNQQRVSMAFQELLNRKNQNGFGNNGSSVQMPRIMEGSSTFVGHPQDNVINLTGCDNGDAINIDDDDDDTIDIDADDDENDEDMDFGAVEEVNIAEFEEFIVLTTIFPDVDETWLRERLQEHGLNPECLMVVSNLMSERSYPKKELKTGPTREELKSIKFDDEEFLKLYPDPVGYFHRTDGVQRTQPNASYSVNALYELVAEFRTISSRQIEKLFKTTQSYAATRCKLMKALKRKRKNVECPRPKKYQTEPTTADEIFFREFWFARNEDRLKSIMEDKEAMRQLKMTEARASGILFTCPICYDDEVLPDEVLSCMAGHEFCPGCVRRSAEVAIGDGHTRFACLADDCKCEFSALTLLSILPQSMYNKALDKKLGEDLKAAGDADTDLVQCPFCVYVVSMPDPNDKVLRCRNPDCMKESCRICKELNHVPLRCNEVEKDVEMDFRKKVELEMTEAMLRTCPKCKKRFFKIDGCNKMTCTCGTTMCYLCREPNIGYEHFQQKGGCTLHTNTSGNFHQNEAIQAAKTAKENFTRDNPDVVLKHDPTKDLKKGGGGMGKNKKGRGGGRW